MNGLEGKGVLVTGGSRGIGRATVHRFVAEGSRLFLCGLDAPEVDEAVRATGAASGEACDVSVEADVERLIASAAGALGRIDVLINNAGIARKDAFLEIGADSWDRTIAVNLRGMFLVGQAVLGAYGRPVASLGDADARRMVLGLGVSHRVTVENWFGSTKTLDVHIAWLRKKLEDDPAHPRYITTIRGVGFRFAAPQDVAPETDAG